MDGLKFEFNDIISLYKKNDSERRRTYTKFQINHNTISIRSFKYPRIILYNHNKITKIILSETM
ncbi:Uncharacterized protein FWK35_00030601, partial [Aphis craccivora]